MARPILVLALLVAPLIAQADDCTSKHGADVQALQDHVKAGPLYKALVGQGGRPVSCHFELDEGKITLIYAFRSPMELRAQVDPALEANEQRVRIPRMAMAKAIALLKAAEQDAYHPNGCGIAWNHPAEKTVIDGAQETVYRGTNCNCQARVTSRGNYAVSLVLKSVC